MMRGLTFVVVASVLAVALGGIGLAIAASTRLPHGAVPVAWDKAACAHCQMHVGEPPFACQVQTRGGEVLNFDDPGCLFEHLDEVSVDVHAIWFRHHHDDRWIPAAEVGFVDVEPTPMGFGLAAVDRAATGSVSLEDARRRARARR